MMPTGSRDSTTATFWNWPNVDMMMRPKLVTPMPTTPDSQPAPEEEALPPLIVPGAVLAGVGAAGLVLGAVFGGLALSKKNVVEEHCVEAQCSLEGFEASEDARTFARVSTVSFIAGGALAAVGITLLVIGATSNDTTGWIVPTASGIGVVF